MENNMNNNQQPDMNPMDMMPMGQQQQVDYSFHKFLIDNESIVNDMENKFKGIGLIWDEIERGYVMKKIDEPLLNEVGVRAIMSKIRFYCSPNFQFTYYESDELSRIMEKMVKAIVPELGVNYKKYGIPKQDVQGVKDMVLNAIHASLKKSEKGRLMDHIQKISTLTQHQTIGGGDRSGGGQMSGGGQKKRWLGFF